MTYSKQTWVDGAAGATPLSAARLNHIEDGIEAVEQNASRIRVTSGRWYGSPCDTTTARTLTTGVLFFTPWRAGLREVDALAANVTIAASAGGLLRLGLYTATAGDLPGTLIEDAGTVDSTGTGIAQLALATSHEVSGLVFLAVVAQVAGCTVTGQSAPVDGGISGAAAADIASACPATYYQSGPSTGALPETASGSPSVSGLGARVIARIA